MRKITKEMSAAFLSGSPFKKSNTKIMVNNFANCGTLTQIFLHGNLIAEHSDEGLKITNAGWFSNTTKERLNGLPGVSIFQKRGKWFLNGFEWRGEWVKIS
jgi:hypothetical protein